MLSKEKENNKLSSNVKKNEFCLICFSDLHQGMNLTQFLYHDDIVCCDCRRKMIPQIYDIKIGNLSVTGIYLYEDIIRTLMLQYKELYDEALAKIFLYTIIKQIKKKYEGYLLVPIPSTKKREQQRGFSHVELLFRDCGFPITNILEKKEEVEQKELSYLQRQKISFTLKEGSKIERGKILLIDDIVTTGNSMIQASKLFRDKTLEIYGLTVCIHRKLLEEEL